MNDEYSYVLYRIMFVVVTVFPRVLLTQLSIYRKQKCLVVRLKELEASRVDLTLLKSSAIAPIGQFRPSEHVRLLHIQLVKTNL